MSSDVAIVGGGPAGLFLAHLLARGGIEAVVLERRSRAYVEQRVRAGVIEYGIANLIHEVGVGERMRLEGLVHGGLELRFGGRGHRIDFAELTGKSVTVYGQQELVKDLIAARVAIGQPLLFDAEVLAVEGLSDNRPVVRYRHDGRERRLDCRFVIGCDGFHGVSRAILERRGHRIYERTFPVAWLGILAAVAPSSEELIYSRHERGFALLSMRSPSVSRLYLQVEPEEDLTNWTDDRIWGELGQRFATDSGFSLAPGPILERGLTQMRSVVIEPVAFDPFFLAGDSAHIVPPTGAKGMNLALADARDLSAGLVARLQDGDEGPLKGYSSRVVGRAWQAQEFSTFMTTLLHPVADDEFGNRVQVARLEQLVGSKDAARHFADRYVDLASHGAGWD